MKLFLCEKPSQGRDIARELSATERGDGCLYTPDHQIYVTWCVGHLLEQCSPEQYDPVWKRWALETLPIIPSQWKMMTKSDGAKQLKVVESLIKKAHHLIIATDADREGESIAREILDKAQYRGTIQRYWASGQDPISIRRALASLKSNADTVNFYYAAQGRARADWLIGMNFSRLFTLLAQAKGYQGTPLSVGRVQSPTLALVVNRDREIKNFVSKNYYALPVRLSAKTGGQFMAQLVIPENYLNEDGLCLDAQFIQQASQKINQVKVAQVVNVKTKRIKESAPLLFALSDLQGECNRLFGMGAQQVLDIAQSLYETHKVTTYPRTDCGYLPESQLADAPDVIKNLVALDNNLKPLVPHLTPNQKSRAWNDAKITAHHGIIPTLGRADLNKLTTDEFKIYDLIRRRYLAQFLPLCETDKTEMLLDSAGLSLLAKGNATVIQGWKILFAKSSTDDSDAEQQGLPVLQPKELCQVLSAEMKTLQTTPPNHYTEGTLLSAMKNAARFVTDERLKQRLRETEGLGTEATRAGLIQGLIDKHFLTKKGKYILASPEAMALIDSLPPLLKDPGLTALWEQSLNQIAEGTLTLSSFMQKQEQFVRYLMQECLKSGISLGNIQIKKCPKCGSVMIKRNGKNGPFYGCSKYPECDGIENIGNKKVRSKKSGVRKSTTERRILT